nr:chitobiase/beta-hexosaminidase C-terminal domain-containing protein [Lachnospiraceae bacterium]
DLTKANTRNITIKAAAGDTIVLYAGQHAADDASKESYPGPITYHFEGNGQHDKQALSSTTGRVYKKLVFTAEHTGIYKIWPECENKGKPMYNRVMRIPSVNVSGTINFGAYTGTGHTVKFVNETTGAESIAELDGTNFTVSLAPGYQYTAVLSGAPGYGFASEGKTITPTEDDIASGITNVSLTVEAKNMCTYSGKITGFAADYNTGRLSIMMTPPEDSKADPVRLDIKEDLSFEAELELNVQYKLQLSGVDDYEIKSALVVNATADLTDDIQVGLKPTYTVSGGFIGLEDAEVTELTFTLLNEEGAEDSNYVYKAAIVNGAYTVRLRDGAYLAKAVVTGYTTRTHVVVNGEDVYKDLMFVSTATEGALERAANLYVGYPGKKNNFNTVSEAVKAAKRMPTPTSEAQRITIHIAPGTYREQIIVNVPYLTFTNDEPSKGDVLLTWYYGIGYAYYSAKNGYYDEERAHDKYEKGNADRWGCAVRVTASDFRAENIVFENSFSRYITEEEIADGVELHTEGTDSKATYVRRINSTVAEIRSKAAVERAAAIALDADKAEFYKCEFYGSQDTVYTGSNGVHSYFKDCFIEGNTDFLFGDSNSVYENCKLSFAGYSVKEGGKNSDGGIIAVNQAGSEHGYLFWGCTITRGKELNNGFGDLGRPWRANARVTYVNTIQESADLITDGAWQDMSGASAKDNPNYAEYNTTLPDGTPVTIKSGTVRAMKYKTENPVNDKTVFFDGWTPAYLTYDDTKVVREPVSSEKRSDVETGTTITLSCDTKGAKIYYTVDGEDPTGKDSELYTEGTKISLGNEEKTVIVKAIAKTENATSNLAVFEYTVKSLANLIAAPTATVESGTVAAGTTVKLTCATNGAAIYFTIDGSEPEVDSNLLYRNQAIVISETTTIKAISVKDTNKSSVVTFQYNVKPTITIEPGDGTAFPSTGGAVTLTASKGAKIYYTISATQSGLTDPADESNTKREEYTGTPIQIKEETYIWAVAVSGDLTSDAFKCHYTVLEEGVVVKPTATPDGSEPVKSGTIVKLDVTDDTVEQIYYTTDGSDPIASDTRKTYNPIAGIVITEAVTIKAAAQKGDTYSEVATFTYTISSGGNTSDDSEKPKDPVAITLDDCEVVVPSVIQKKATDPIKPETYVTYKGYRFVAGLDYSVSDVSGPDSDGYYSVTLTGLERDNNGRMEETYKIAESPTKEAKFKVVSAPAKGDTSIVDFSKAKVSLDALAKTAVYTGSAIEPKLDADPKKDKDGLVTKLGDRINYAYKNNINAGKATVTISVKPPKPTDEDQTIYAGSKTFTFNIKKAALNKNQDKNPEKATAKVVYENPDNLDYKGNGVGIELKSCKVTVGTTPNVVELKKDRDYTITYKNNAKAGKATVTVKGIGNNVSGSWSTDYTITALKLEELTINAADQTMYYSPKGAKLGTITAKKGSDTYTLKEGTDFTAKYVYGEKTKAAGTDVEVTISGKNGCTGKNIAIEGKIKIAQADFEKCITVSSDVVLDKTTKAGKEQAALAKTLAVTDTSGAKLKLDKDYKMTLKIDEKTNAPIVVIEPKDETNSNYKGSKIVSYRVAANLAKEKTFVMDKNLEKTAPLGYDGRNPVQITQREIDTYINTPNSTNYRLGTNIKIVPGTYKNNTKKGTAQVTVQGIGELYGTKVLKFKIVEK